MIKHLQKKKKKMQETSLPGHGFGMFVFPVGIDPSNQNRRTEEG